MGHNFLIIVDVHSKWLDIHIMSSTTSAATIDTLRRVFATHELPRTIVSDNGTAFTSAEFAQFVKLNGIKHVRTAPFPSSIKWTCGAHSPDFQRHYEKDEGQIFNGNQN